MTDLPPQTVPPGFERLGRYRIVRKIAEGGMGAVYEAEQDNPRRTVALKVIRPDLSSDELLRRFESEAQILGRLQHPGIAQVYEAGHAQAPDGREQPFFAMEFVDGLPLTDYAREQGLGTRERVALLVRVSEAVQHAHQRGVIHRDLKPANILVDRGGQPKILDFGLARLTDVDMQLTTLRTDIGQILGTMPYMSPEQIAADPLELDTRSDVYTLGVILYELLAERLPYDLDRTMIHEAARIIREVDPAPLSSTSRFLRGDIETIVTKALEKDKAHRYDSAAELATDLDNYLHHRPIQARAPSALYQIRKFARRHKALVASCAAVFLVLTAGVVVSTLLAIRASRAEGLALERLGEADAARQEAVDARSAAETARESERQQRIAAEESARAAQREASKAQATLEFVQNMLASADPSQSGRPDVTVREILDDAGLILEREQGLLEPEVEAAIRVTIGATYTTLGLYEAAESELREALRFHRERYGEDSLEAARVEGRLGWVRLQQNAFEEAEELLERSIEAQEAAYGRASQQVAAGMSTLAVLRYNQGRFEEATALDRESLALRREVFGEESPEVARAMGDLGFRLLNLHHAAEAEPLLRGSLEIFEKCLGPDHPKSFGPLRDLGALLNRQGRTAEAEEVLRRLLANTRQAYGEAHPKVADALLELGTLLFVHRRVEEAEPLLRESLAMRRRFLGDHRDTASAATSLASLLHGTGRLEEAEGLHREALEMRRGLYGDVSPAVGDSLRRLGDLMVIKEEREEAERFFREAIDVWRATLGEDSPDLASPMLALGRLLRDRGALAEAQELFAQALALCEARLQEGHGKLWDLRDELIRVLLAREDWPAAEALARDVIAIAESRYPPGHVARSHLEMQLGAALAGSGRFEDAEALMLPSWEVLRDNQKIWPATKVQALECLSGLYEAWGRPVEAAAFRERIGAYAE